MKLFKVFLAILVVVFLLGSPLVPQGQAATLIGLTDNSPSTATLGALIATKVYYFSWTQTVPTSNTTISAIIFSEPPTQSLNQAWLTNHVGPGTTVTNVLAEADFIGTSLIPDSFNLNTATYTPIFTGLSLAPGSYYLVLYGTFTGNFGTPPTWHGDYQGVGVDTAPGFTVGLGGFNTSPTAFPPDSNFATFPGGTYLFYRAEGVAIPLPGSVLLLGTGLIGLGAVGRRRRRRS